VLTCPRVPRSGLQLIVDNEAFPAPLAPPLPDDVCQALGIRPGDAEHDGITCVPGMPAPVSTSGYTPG
jgi:hypothetical protein